MSYNYFSTLLFYNFLVSMPYSFYSFLLLTITPCNEKIPLYDKSYYFYYNEIGNFLLLLYNVFNPSLIILVAESPSPR